ncbi:MAG: Na+/H+ antiporter [Chloroflexota bacterium]
MTLPLAALDPTAGEEVAGSPTEAIAIVLVLLVAATALAMLARRIGIPYPILLVLGGLALGLVPGLPTIALDPEIVFLLFLPPILFGAGYFTSLRDFRRNLRAITLLSVGLVIATTIAVAAVAQSLVPGMGWAPAFALGAIVAPPDAVAATSVFQRLGVPRRVVTILEGESLVNDATALVAYRFAIVAASTGMFSIQLAGLTFLAIAIGGIAFGLLMGLLIASVLRRVDDPVFSVVLTFLAPVATYLPAEQFGISGVLATVAAGIWVGRHAPREMSSSVRVAGTAAWQVLLFLINGTVFILIGAQLRSVLAGLGAYSPGQLIGLAVVICVVVIATRILWVYPGTYVPRALSAGIRVREPYPPRRNVFIVSWAGMRGVVSLAAALALPLYLGDGVTPFPFRDLIIFLAFAVILATLVGQGLTLPFFIRRLGIVADTGDTHEEAHARTTAAEAAVDRIEELAKEFPDHMPLIDTLRAQYSHRASHVEQHSEASLDESEEELFEHRRIRGAVIEAEREALLQMRERGAVTDEVFRRVERDIDLEELRMEA